MDKDPEAIARIGGQRRLLCWGEAPLNQPLQVGAGLHRLDIHPNGAIAAKPVDHPTVTVGQIEVQGFGKGQPGFAVFPIVQRDRGRFTVEIPS